ncbi:MAG: hypothetical protein K2M36_05150, partial [Clostridia bacterium]|nr:hypothetical protein [Clostridia bacterium]
KCADSDCENCIKSGETKRKTAELAIDAISEGEELEVSEKSEERDEAEYSEEAEQGVQSEPVVEEEEQ